VKSQKGETCLEYLELQSKWVGGGGGGVHCREGFPEIDRAPSGQDGDPVGGGRRGTHFDRRSSEGQGVHRRMNVVHRRKV